MRPSAIAFMGKSRSGNYDSDCEESHLTPRTITHLIHKFVNHQCEALCTSTDAFLAIEALLDIHRGGFPVTYFDYLNRG